MFSIIMVIMWLLFGVLRIVIWLLNFMKVGVIEDSGCLFGVIVLVLLFIRL